MDDHMHGRSLMVNRILIGVVLLILAPALWAVPRFDPNTECTSELSAEEFQKKKEEILGLDRDEKDGGSR